MRLRTLASLAALAVLLLSTSDAAPSQAGALRAAGKTLVAVVAHGDDEGPVSPVLARYARVIHAPCVVTSPRRIATNATTIAAAMAVPNTSRITYSPGPLIAGMA